MGTLIFRHAVFGQPIAHSWSPRIHAAFAAQFGIAVDYRAIEAGPENFALALDDFARRGGCGANVTSPLKQEALRQCGGLSARAARAGSVNTLTRSGDAWLGDTTDGSGLLRDLEERHGYAIAGRRLLLLGAGGAARAVTAALLDAGVAALTIANRSLDRAKALLQAFDFDQRMGVSAWADLPATGDFDLIINAVSAGHQGAAVYPQIRRLHTDSVCYDLSYGPAAHAFMDWADRIDASQIFDGLGMLVEQAAESFAIWHGRRPETQGIFDELRSEQDARAQQAPG